MSNIWVVGTGTMGAAHLAALRQLGREPVIIGRSEARCEMFRQEQAVQVISGGAAAALSTSPPPEYAIIASPIPALFADLAALVAAGSRRILVEKPVTLTQGPARDLLALAEQSGAEVFVGYNRRFYASVTKARTIIGEDGGVTSFAFDFTEVEERILPYGIEPDILANWFVANSTHVVDTAFHLCGEPTTLVAAADRHLSWHPTSRFTGHGDTNRGASFSYHSDWMSAGRWGLDICTPRRRLILRPFEQLQHMRKGSFASEGIALDDEFDRDFKPGIVAQAQAFLAGETNHLMTLEAQVARFDIYDTIRFGGRLG